MRVTEPYTIFARQLKSGKTVYYYQYRDENGIRSGAKSTGCDTLAKARRFCQKLYNNNEFHTTGSLTFNQFSKGFFDPHSEYNQWKAVNGNPTKPSTLRRYRTSLQYHILPFFGDMILQGITVATIKQWVIWASDEWSAKTVNNAQGVLNLIFEYALEKDIIRKNPCHNVKYRKITKTPRTLLTINELNELYHLPWPSERHRQMFLFACITGMRIGEISALKKTDVKGNYLDVTKTYVERVGVGTTKTDVCRFVPIPEGFVFADSPNDWLFGAEDNLPIMPHCIYNALMRRCEKLGIDVKGRKITLHSLRNFFISYMQGENVPLNKIKAVVGHRDKDMTDWYTYWTPNMVQEIYEKQEKLYKEIIRSKENYAQRPNPEL